MNSILPALASRETVAPAPRDSAALASDLRHPALVALVRLLARQAAREWLAQTTIEATQDSSQVPFGSMPP